MLRHKGVIIPIAVIFILLSSCVKKNSLTIVSDRVEDAEQSGNSITASLRRSLASANITLTVSTDSTNRERAILEKINSGEEDMALIKNSIRVDDSYSNIRTVMPLFPEVFITLYKDTGNNTDFDSLVTHGKIVFITNKDEELQLINKFLNLLKLKPRCAIQVNGHYNPTTLHAAVQEADVVMLFSSLNSRLLRTLLREEERFRLYDFNAGGYSYGSVIDGFCLQFGQAVPFTIPKGTFDNLPGTPVQTFAVYDILVCHKQLESELIYDFIESIFNFKARLAQDNFEFALLQEDFDNHTFLFPLHAGSTAFLNRNQPTFWERYAELIGLVVSILAIAAGALSTMVHQLKQRKKDKIDEYYMKVITIGSRSYQPEVSTTDLQALLQELLRIRLHVFQLLIDERISANSAFIIFLLLTQSTVQHLESRLEHTALFNDPALFYKEN
jgi:hypothetical protein